MTSLCGDRRERDKLDGIELDLSRLTRRRSCAQRSSVRERTISQPPCAAIRASAVVEDSIRPSTVPRDRHRQARARIDEQLVAADRIDDRSGSHPGHKRDCRPRGRPSASTHAGAAILYQPRARKGSAVSR
jgi:hypothetical protein